MIPKTDMLRRWTALQTERSSWIAHWRELSDYLLPRSTRFYKSDRNKGTKKHNAIFDSTASRSLRILSAGMMSGMTGMRMITATERAAKDRGVKMMLWHAKPGTTLDRMLPKLGYDPFETIHYQVL